MRCLDMMRAPIFLQAVLEVGCLCTQRRGAVQVAKRPHFSRRWHNRSDVRLFPSRYNGAKFSQYLSGID